MPAPTHLTTQMLWRSEMLRLLTPRSAIGVAGPPTRRVALLLTRLAGGVGGAPAPPALRGVGPISRPPAALLLLLPGDVAPSPARLCLRLLVAAALAAARAAAAASTSTARPSSRSNA